MDADTSRGGHWTEKLNKGQICPLQLDWTVYMRVWACKPVSMCVYFECILFCLNPAAPESGHCDRQVLKKNVPCL